MNELNQTKTNVDMENRVMVSRGEMVMLGRPNGSKGSTV